VASHKRLEEAIKTRKYRYAGISCRIARSSQPPFDIPIFDSRNKTDNVHVYTTSEKERAQLLAMGLENNGILGYLCRTPSANGIPRLVPVLQIRYCCGGGTMHMVLDTSHEGVAMSMLSDYQSSSSQSIIGYAVPPY